MEEEENIHFICFGCNKKIPKNESYFRGYIHPPLYYNKFGCAPYANYCEECMNKFPSYFHTE
jgi:hypothetical protein